MTDETRFVDDLSFLVKSLKQHALMKVVETLIRPDLEANRNISCWLFCDPLERLSVKIKRLHIPNSLKTDIRDVVLYLYSNSQHFAFTNSFPSSALKFNVCGDWDVDRSFDSYVDDILRGPRPSRKYLMTFLSYALDFHQDRSVHLTLCELLASTSSNLEPFLRHARREVNVRREENGYRWYYDIRFVIEDVDDEPVPWISFADDLNIGSRNEFSFEGNTFSVTTRVEKFEYTFLLPWTKMTTLQKVEHAERIFKAALGESDMHFLIQTMRYVNPSRIMNLIKRNLVSFIMCFLLHPYYRHFLPDLQLVEEDLQLVQEESRPRVFSGDLLEFLDVAGDYTNIADSLIQLWRYVSSRNSSLGDHVLHEIRKLLYGEPYGWKIQHDRYNDNEAFCKLRAVFPA